MEGFDAQIDEVMEAIQANLKEVAEVVKVEAQTTSVFADKTGTLRKSIKLKKSKFEDGGYIVFTKAPHSGLVEFGHVLIAWGNNTGRRVQPYPFMRPSVDKGIRKAITLFRGNK